MNRMKFCLAFAIAAASPTLADDVPFAAPPLVSPGLPSAPSATLGDIMGKLQLRHIKLWFAIKSRNWDLTDYELGQMRDSFENAVILYRNIPVELIASATNPLITLQAAAKAKDFAKAERGFTELTVACNACHKAAQIGFITIQTPTSSPFADQAFSPLKN
ncbi:hypothetical protein [Methylocapsa acidiphila]|uniref:hypothetical protein n=1 Tax=Methylocapsa acidiphila TaxID=133552 RepID=UPI0004243312|nr:hypothetical protein [Methylocapsa acidiphila]